MKFPPSFLEDLRQRISLARVIGVAVPLKKSGTSLKGLCPFHKEKTPSFTVHEEKGFYNCFGCGARGDVFDFLMQTQGFTFPEVVERIADECGVKMPVAASLPQKQEEDTQNRLYLALLEATCVFFQQTLQQQLRQEPTSSLAQYLKTRGLLPSTLEKFRLGYAPGGNLLKIFLQEKGFQERAMQEMGLVATREGSQETYAKFRHRLMFPIFDRRGRVIAFGGRLLGDGHPKYLNSPESSLFHKRQTLYGLSLARQAVKAKHPLLVCEGYMDVISLYQAGFLGAVAPLGTAMGEEQIQEAWRLSEEPLLCFDGDAAGQEAALRVALKALPLLEPGKSLKFIALPVGEDPDSLLRGGRRDFFSHLITQSTPLSDVLWDSLLQKTQPTTPERQALLLKEIGQLTETIRNGPVKASYARVLKERFYATFKRPSSFSASSPSSFSSLKGLRLDPLSLQRKILLATVMNHPNILGDIFEEFMTFDLPIAEMQRIRDDIVEWMEKQEEDTADSLKNFLYTQGDRTILDSLLAQDLCVHARFCAPHRSDEEALKGWRDVYMRLVKQPQTGQDLRLAQRTLSQGMDEKTWGRVKALTHFYLDEETPS